MKKWIVLVLAALLALSLLTACGGGSSLAGEWKLEEGTVGYGDTIEFSKDGTMTAAGFSFTWKTSEDTLTVTTDQGAVRKFTYVISGSKLTLTESDNLSKTAVYKK